QKDYYAVAGILGSTNTLKGIMTDVFSDPNRVQLPATAEEKTRFEADLARYEQTHKDLKSREETLQAQKKSLETQLAEAKKQSSAESGSGSQNEAPDGETERLKKELARVEGRLNELSSRIKLVEYMKPMLPVAFGVDDGEKPEDIHITIRGNAHA